MRCWPGPPQFVPTSRVVIVVEISFISIRMLGVVWAQQMYRWSRILRGGQGTPWQIGKHKSDWRGAALNDCGHMVLPAVMMLCMAGRILSHGQQLLLQCMFAPVPW